MGIVELVKNVSERSGVSRESCKKVVEAFFGLAKDELRNGNDFLISGIGTLKIHEQAERTCRNPKTGESIEVPACRTVKFSVLPAFKKSL